MKTKKERRKVKTQTENDQPQRLSKGVILPIVSLFFLFLFFTFNVIAQPQTNIQVSTADEKIEISYPKSNIQEQYEGFNVQFRTFNVSSGKFLDNETCDCNVTLLDSKGDIIYQKTSEYNSTSRFWQNDINGSYFEETGKYRYEILCIDGEIDGFVSGKYEVTNVNNQNLANILFFSTLALGILIYAFSYSRDDSGHTILISGASFIISGLISINYMGAFFESHLTNMLGYLVIGIGLIVLGDAIWRLFPNK